MFGLGPTELIVILVLALLVLGPQRIPEAASSLGKAIRSFRRATRELRDQIDIDDDVRRPFEDLRSALRDEPAPLPPPSGPQGTAAAAGVATLTESPALLQPPAEPVVRQGEDEGSEAATAAPAGSATAPKLADDTPAAAPPLSPGAPVLALAASGAVKSQASESGPADKHSSTAPESR